MAHPVLQARVIPWVLAEVTRLAQAEGITVSEWLRRVVWAELRRKEKV